MHIMTTKKMNLSKFESQMKTRLNCTPRSITIRGIYSVCSL